MFISQFLLQYPAAFVVRADKTGVFLQEICHVPLLSPCAFVRSRTRIGCSAYACGRTQCPRCF